VDNTGTRKKEEGKEKKQREKEQGKRAEEKMNSKYSWYHESGVSGTYDKTYSVPLINLKLR